MQGGALRSVLRLLQGPHRRLHQPLPGVRGRRIRQGAQGQRPGEGGQIGRVLWHQPGGAGGGLRWVQAIIVYIKMKSIIIIVNFELASFNVHLLFRFI